MQWCARIALLCLAAQTTQFAAAEGVLPVRVPLHAIGDHVGVALRITDAVDQPRVVDTILDTSSADVILRNASGLVAPQIKALEDNEHALFFDGELVVFADAALRGPARVALLGRIDDTNGTVNPLAVDATADDAPVITAATFASRSRLHRAWADVGGLLGAAYPGAALVPDPRRNPEDTWKNSTFTRLLRGAVGAARRDARSDADSSDASEDDTGGGGGGNDVFALDVEPGRGGELHLGAPAPRFARSLRWSEAFPLSRPGRRRHEFPMFHLGACGVDLFSNYSSHWPAVVDTGAACLTLPGEFFDMVMAWAPSECFAVDEATGELVDAPFGRAAALNDTADPGTAAGDSHGDDTSGGSDPGGSSGAPTAGPTAAADDDGEKKGIDWNKRIFRDPRAHAGKLERLRCYLPKGAGTDVPWLSFGLREDGAPLHLPLRDLLVPEVFVAARRDGTTARVVRQRYCIVRSYNVHDGAPFPHPAADTPAAIFSPPLTRISVGSLALRSLYVAFDMDEGRVGFANKPGALAAAAAAATEGALKDGGGDADGAASQRQCAQRKTCVGLERFYAPRNLCLPPPCKNYYFQEIDPTTQECMWSWGFQATAFTALLLVIGGQLSTNYFYWEADAKLRAKLAEIEAGGELKED